jgi:predicted esterase
MSYLDSLKQKVDLRVTLPVTYLFQEAQRPTNKTVLMLHGYQDTASGLFKRAFGEEERHFDYNILVPNGLFPLPIKSGEGFKEAFAWYFVDPSKNLVLIPPEVAAENLLALIKQLSLEANTFHIVGFSQGGILAPFVARELSNVSGIIGVGTLFLPDLYDGLKNTLPVDAIHGADDEIITMASSQKGYQELKQVQPRPGEYYQFKGLTHTIDDAARAKLKELIELRLLQNKG